MWNSLSCVMEAAAIIAIALANGGGKPQDWQDFVGVITLLLINFTIRSIEGNNVGNAAAILMARLASKAKVLRDGRWTQEEATVLLGDIIPAYPCLLNEDPLKIDQSSLTGESLPAIKGPSDGVYSGSTVKQGEIEAARASKIENQDAIDKSIAWMLGDPKEGCAGVEEVHFLPSNAADERTAFTYIDSDGDMYRVSKGAPEQILKLAHNKSEIEQKVHSVIDKFAKRGVRSLDVEYQDVPYGRKDGPGTPWHFVALLPLCDPPRQDSAEPIQRAPNLGVNVKMIKGFATALQSYKVYIVLLLLAMHVVVGTAGEKPKGEDPCQPFMFASRINLDCGNDVPLTEDCCPPVIASVDIEGMGTDICMCRVAAEPQFLMSGLKKDDLLAIFASCGAIAPRGAPLEAVCEGVAGSPPPPTTKMISHMHEQHYETTTASNSIGRRQAKSNSTVKVLHGDVTTFCTPHSFALQLGEFCSLEVADGDCCLAVMSIVNIDSSKETPCLCQVIEQWDFLSTGFEVEDILTLYKMCTGRQGIQRPYQDICGW